MTRSPTVSGRPTLDAVIGCSIWAEVTPGTCEQLGTTSHVFGESAIGAESFDVHELRRPAPDDAVDGSHSPPGMNSVSPVLAFRPYAATSGAG